MGHNARAGVLEGGRGALVKGGRLDGGLSQGGACAEEGGAGEEGGGGADHGGDAL